MDSNYNLKDNHEQNSSLKALFFKINCKIPINKKLNRKKYKKGVKKVKLANDDKKKL